MTVPATDPGNRRRMLTAGFLAVAMAASALPFWFHTLGR